MQAVDSVVWESDPDVWRCVHEAALGETSSHSRNVEHWPILIAETACTAEVDRGGRSVDGW